MTEARADVSAVMLTCGQWSYTRRCLESLSDDLDAGMQLVVVDNGSSDGSPERTAAFLDRWPQCRVIESPINLGFAAGSNLGALSTTGRYVLFINNDVVVPRGWLDRLIDHLREAPSAGLAGPRSNRIAGQQKVPTVDYDEESLEGYDAFTSRLASARDRIATPVTRIIGFCMLVRRQVLDTIGGFDPRFAVGNFEDDDFCLRARLADFRVLQAEDVFVHHFGGRTFHGLGIERNASVLANWEIFKRKWDLPPDRSVRQFYSDTDFAGLRFDFRKHFVPLESCRPEPLPIEQRREFNFLMIVNAASSAWEASARDYLSAFDADDDVALLVRGNPPDATPVVLERLASLTGEMEIPPSRCADVVGVDFPLLPRDEARLFASSDAILTAGEPLMPAHHGFAVLAGRHVIEDTSPRALREVAAREKTGGETRCRST